MERHFSKWKHNLSGGYSSDQIRQCIEYADNDSELYETGMEYEFCEISDLLDKYDILSYIDICYEEYNSMGIKGILNDLKTHISALERAV